jgi:hypothetical protein
LNGVVGVEGIKNPMFVVVVSDDAGSLQHDWPGP